MLLRRIRDGDQNAFIELLGRNRGPAWSVCLRITGNCDDAEDAFQEAIASAWQSIGHFRGESRFSTWLFRIAANAALAVVRQRGPTPVCGPETACAWADPGDRVAEAQRVQDALLKLPGVFRCALVLRIYGDFSYHEIAVHEGIPVQTVKSRISRARVMMASFLGPADEPAV